MGCEATKLRRFEAKINTNSENVDGTETGITKMLGYPLGNFSGVVF